MTGQCYPGLATAPSTQSPATVNEALSLLRSLGANAWLVRHHELVAEAARELVEGLAGTLRFDALAVLVGAAPHDAGKVLHPAEMSGPGSVHEGAGETLLLDRGVSPPLARFCRTHADPSAPGAAFEDLLVALADKLWKGKRVPDLEAHLASELEAQGCERWQAFALVVERPFARVSKARVIPSFFSERMTLDEGSA